MEIIADELTFCPICYDTRARIYVDKKNRKRFLCDCCVCGRYISNEDIDFSDLSTGYDIDELASFMFYNNDKAINDLNVCDATIISFDGGMIENDEFKKKLDQANIPEFHIVPIYPNTVKSWVPHSFAEKIDKILLYIYKNTSRLGESCSFTENELSSLSFLHRNELVHGSHYENLMISNIRQQKDFLWQWICTEGYAGFTRGELTHICWNPILCGGRTDEFENNFEYRLLPKGYTRIDDIEKASLNADEVLVAMQFGEETQKLREKIKEGIRRAGYKPVLIDEVEHNDQIIPELLYKIRQSKFIVVDLTHGNSGAYFEEGYAMGYGKPVIQMCKAGIKLHFDIAQKNTIMWNSEEEIPERLAERIKATIE